jgi:hypothetical protein
MEPKIIRPSEIVHVGSSTGIPAIIGPENSQRYLKTSGVSTCSALALHFPRSGIAALVHLLPHSGLSGALHNIKLNVSDTIEAPEYFFQDGPRLLHTSKYGIETGYDISIIERLFPGATPSRKTKYGTAYQDPDKNYADRYNYNDYFDVIIDKLTGNIRLYTLDGLPLKSDFEDPAISLLLKMII